MDLALGQGLAGGEGDAEGAQVGPADAAERARWERLLDATSLAFAPGLDRGAEARVTARVLAQARADDERAARDARVPAEPSRRGFWWRVVAVSVAAHAAVFSVLTWSARGRDPEAPALAPFVVTSRMEKASDVPLETKDVGVLPALPEMTAYVEELLDVERMFPGGDLLEQGPLPVGERAQVPLRSRTFLVRTSDPMKRAIETRVGTPGSLDVRRSLDGLAKRQRADGSFPSREGVDVGEATALVLLPFLGDGNSSRFGPHRAVVEKGIAFLRARRDAGSGDVAGGERVLWALAEDFSLANGSMTPAEGRERAAEVRPLVGRVAVVARSESAPADVRLALDAATRARLAEPQPVFVTAVARVEEYADGDVRVGNALERGSAILSAGDSKAFRRWMASADRTLRGLLDADGLVRADGTSVSVGASEAERVEATARALLALQVPLR